MKNGKISVKTMKNKGSIPSLNCFRVLNPILWSICPIAYHFSVNQHYFFTISIEIGDYDPLVSQTWTHTATTDIIFGLSTPKLPRKNYSHLNGKDRPYFVGP